MRLTEMTKLISTIGTAVNTAVKKHVSAIVLLLITIGTYFNGCRTVDKSSQQTDLNFEEADADNQNQEGVQAAQNDDVNNSAFAEEQQDSATAQKKEKNRRKRNINIDDTSTLKLFHPKEPTAWFTRRLLMSYPQPSAARINDCRSRVDSVATQAPNLRALDEIALTLEPAVEEDIAMYHWCFYQMMADLDIKLDADTSLMEDKALIFLARMRSLWVLAKSLDATNYSSTYMKYLRTRYTEINQNVFGRNLERMNRDTFTLPATGPGKPAAKFEE